MRLKRKEIFEFEKYLQKARIMPNSKCEICGRRPKKGDSSKGYFRVPTENSAKRQWQAVIPSDISESTRVCYRHWAEEHLELRDGGKVFPKEGM